ncbi:MAG TPA: hypothetical protein DEH25_13480 [Chloroflexi bacterium]|nr:hypothetical protein [Chloroflexota bacterium]
MKNRKSILLFIVSLLVAVFLLAACSSNEPTPAPTEVPPVEVAPDEGAVPEAVTVLPTPAAGEPSLTAKANVNVRSGPSQQYPVYGVLAGGQVAKLVGISADKTYFAVDFPLAPTGSAWIDAKFAVVTGADGLPVLEAPPVPPTTVFTPPQPSDPQVVARQEVYVRSGPGTTFPAYGIAKDGARGLVIGISEDGNWWAVRINPEVVGVGFGWVSVNLVDEENIPENPTVIKASVAPQNVTPPPPAEGAPTATATDYVNVRSGPGTNYPTLIVAAPGATAEIAGKSADGAWWQVKLSTEVSTSGFGWANSAYVSTQNAENVPVVDSPTAPPTNPNPPSGTNACILVSQNPADGTVFKMGATFAMTWEVENVGTDTWTAANSLVTKLGAVVDQPLSAVDSMPLTQDVATGATYVVKVPMTAPDTAGQFGEYWSVTLNDQLVCYFYNVIQVQE